MKTKIFTTVAVLLISISFVSANPTETTLRFWDSMGRMLIQPFQAEEATDSLPAAVKQETERRKQERIYRVYDLSELTKPEEEEELPFDLESVLQTAKKQ